MKSLLIFHIRIGVKHIREINADTYKDGFLSSSLAYSIMYRPTPIHINAPEYFDNIANPEYNPAKMMCLLPLFLKYLVKCSVERRVNNTSGVSGNINIPVITKEYIDAVYNRAA